MASPALALHPRSRRLGVHDAGARGHPLHVARIDHTVVAGGVAVLGLTFEHVRHGLEATVGMVGRANGLAGRDVDGTHLVEKEEGVDHVERRGREGTVHEESAPFEGLDRIDDRGDGPD